VIRLGAGARPAFAANTGCVEPMECRENMAESCRKSAFLAQRISVPLQLSLASGGRSWPTPRAMKWARLGLGTDVILAKVVY
jgi:hypothetical protein